MPAKAQTYNHEQVASSKQPSSKARAKNLDARGVLQLRSALGNRTMGRLLESTAGPKAPTGLPARLKSGIERLSGLAMDDVRVHYNSSKPAEVGALAHTKGGDIYLRPGQEKHLPHEAWHVVQQKQGRVKPTGVQVKGAPVNDDASLEGEADRMGAKAANLHEAAQPHAHLLAARPAEQRAIQRKEVPLEYGKFETTKFVEAEGRGVEIVLKFHPNEDKVNAKKIALAQSVRTTLPSGTEYALDPNTAKRMVPSGKSGSGYYIDQFSALNNPIYVASANLGAAEDLKDTPLTDEIGYCYKENPSDTKKKKRSASLYDKPRSTKTKGRSKMFETTALAIDGADSGKYYGSVAWGYKMEGTDAAPKLTTLDITEASKGTPTANFMEAAKLWNVAKTLGTLQVTADPEATVLKGTGSGTEKLAKGTKLKQLDTVAWGEDPAIKAEVLKADGTGSGKIVYIKNADVKDIGDGTATKKLPVPAEKKK